MPNPEREPMKNETTYHERMNRDLARILGRHSPSNRALLEHWFRELAIHGIKPASLRSKASALLRLDRSTNGTPFAAITRDQLLSFLAEIVTDERTQGGVDAFLVHVKHLYRYLDPRGELPVELKRLLAVRARGHRPDKRILTDHDFRSLLAAAQTPRDRAIVSTLADSGFRASELLSLNIDSYQKRDDGAACLNLPASDGLKTGRRIAVITSAIQPIEDWTGYHPSPNDPTAPLFCATSAGRLGQRLTYAALHRILATIRTRAKLPWVSLHTFRHSRATEAARNNWSDAKMCLQFGWRNSSKMPRHYSHLNADDLAAQILADRNGNRKPAAGPATLPQSGAAPAPLDPLAVALAELLRRGQPLPTK